MPLSPIQKEKLKALELERGGVAFVSEKSSGTPTPTVVISLGGLGAKTLNALKGKFIREIGESDHIYFRMIDTDQREFDKLCKIKSDGTLNDSSVANMEQNETIPLYKSEIANILQETNIAPNIKRWLNSSLLNTMLDNTGAQQIRQIGRAMLTNDVVYTDVRTKLNTVILDAINKKAVNGNVDVIIIAGVSGGTGSGTVIDLTYMVHDIFASAGCSDYRIAGYIYTPDAQFRVQQIASNPATKQNLKKNGYAALKEIDYFMNIVETNSVYRLELGSSEVVSAKNIFSSCTLVSGYAAGGGINEVEHTIGRLTDHLIDMLTDISIVQDGNPVQLSSSILSNENAMLTAWFGEHTARRIYHRYASYKYQVLGYNSIVIPRDEILAYCVNKIYQSVLREFQNFTLVNREMMKKVFQLTNTNNPEYFTQYAITINPNNPITRTIILDGGYTKKMIANNNLIAYEDACQLAQSERLKVNGSFQSVLENSLYESMKGQIDQIFDQYGPYVALKAIEHRSSELSVGNPNEPFPGVIEMLTRLSNKFLDMANQAANEYNQVGATEIKDAAQLASSGIFTNHEAIQAYVNLCCEKAVTSQIDSLLYRVLSDVCNNVAVKMNDYNSEMFDVYTSILTEVQNLLNKDGQYFTQGVTQQEGNKRTFSVDIIKSGEDKTRKLEKYLNSFISKVAVDDLAQNFINQMKNNKDKWLAQNNENDFDVVGEVRALMDACLANNKMKDDIIEKFVTVAYSPTELTPEELEEVWEDNSPDSPKMQALRSAANEIYNSLINGAQTMANSGGMIPLSTYSSQFFISTLSETPKLTEILSGMISARKGYTPAISNSNNKFIITQQYMSVPMYVLLGMDDYNKTYVDNASAGRHMDEQKQNWGRFPNPYTIDAVANDIKAAGRPKQDIQYYPDYNILLDVMKKAQDGFNKYHFIELDEDGTGLKKMYLNEITTKPENMETFKENLYQVLSKNKNLDIIQYMKENGFVINPVEVIIGKTDVDLSLFDFADAKADDLEGKYKDIPVEIPDVYKWLRKSIKYMDIIDKDTVVFEELYEVMERVASERIGKQRYINDVEVFAFALRTGIVKQNETNDKVWHYMNGSTPISVNFGKHKSFDRQYFLYHLFVEFDSMDERRLEAIKAQAVKIIDDGKEVDIKGIKTHIEEVLSENVLGDPFNEESINEVAEAQGVTEHYTLMDKPEDKNNPFKVLSRFYGLLKTSIE